LQQIATATHGKYLRVSHANAWQGLIQQQTVVGKALTRDERKVFQPFLLAALLAFGVQTLIARL
jgi:hypothetical protein